MNQPNFKYLRLQLGLTERELHVSGISRGTLRSLESGVGNPTIQSMDTLAKFMGRKLEILLLPPKDCVSDHSSVAVSMKVTIDGPDSWKIHFMEMADEFRKTQDPRLVLLPPVGSLPPKLKALLASMVLRLCGELNLAPPEWAERRHFLNTPWFPSGVESLKATALLESPLEFRLNNIFVQGNFLSRV